MYFVQIAFVSKDVGWKRSRKEFVGILYDLDEYRLPISSVLDWYIVSLS